jgi:hypothetical protein
MKLLSAALLALTLCSCGKPAEKPKTAFDAEWEKTMTEISKINGEMERIEKRLLELPPGEESDREYRKLLEAHKEHRRISDAFWKKWSPQAADEGPPATAHS